MVPVFIGGVRPRGVFILPNSDLVRKGIIGNSRTDDYIQLMFGIIPDWDIGVENGLPHMVAHTLK